MADIVRAVDGLRLGAQHQIVDRAAPPACPAARVSMRLNSSGRSTCAFGEAEARDADLVEESRATPRPSPGRAHRARGTCRPSPRLQFLGGGDIGEDHEFLDQPVAVEPLARHDRDRPPLARRARPGARGGRAPARRARSRAAVERGEGAVERVEPLRRRAAGSPLPSRAACTCLIGQPRRRAHHRALEAVPALAAVGVDPQMRREAGAVVARLQRAQPVRQRLGQHRHDAVGEIDRIAAPRRLAVERAAGRTYHGDIGDRDDEMPAAGIGRVGVGLGPDRVVEIARVAAVDRDQREVAQIGAARQARAAARRRPRRAPRPGNSCGMSKAAIASRLIAPGASGEPSRSTIRSLRRSEAARRQTRSAMTSSPSAAPPASRGRHRYSVRSRRSAGVTTARRRGRGERRRRCAPLARQRAGCGRRQSPPGARATASAAREPGFVSGGGAALGGGFAQGRFRRRWRADVWFWESPPSWPWAPPCSRLSWSRRRGRGAGLAALVLPLPFCARAAASASASEKVSGSAALGSEAISPSWLT